MMSFLIVTLFVVGYIVIAGIINAILDYIHQTEYNDAMAMLWPIALLTFPFALLFQATYWLITYVLIKTTKKSH